jgi:hypothetical protein
MATISIMVLNASGLESSVFCHRGLWESLSLQNSLQSFESAQNFGFSVETDIRYSEGRAVICHDLAVEAELPHLDLLTGFTNSFALNIKEDGLQSFFVNMRSWIEMTNSFVFDGSVPEMFKYLEIGISHALRLSEFEKTIPWQSGHIWLDSFYEDWWLEDKEAFKVFEGSQVVVVSPELHGRDPRFVWDFLSNERTKGRFDFSICTDRPLEYLSWK